MASRLRWQPPELPRKKIAVHKNTTEYALIVHDGAVLRNGTILPARTWMESAYIENPQGFDPVEVFVDRFEATNDIAKAFRSTALRANTQMKQLIRGDFWKWPRTTIRSGGRRAGSPRNIVDTGELLNNQQDVEFK